MRLLSIKQSIFTVLEVYYYRMDTVLSEVERGLTRVGDHLVVTGGTSLVTFPVQ